jgi:hypothetical protein
MKTQITALLVFHMTGLFACTTIAQTIVTPGLWRVTESAELTDYTTKKKSVPRAPRVTETCYTQDFIESQGLMTYNLLAIRKVLGNAQPKSCRSNISRMKPTGADGKLVCTMDDDSVFTMPFNVVFAEKSSKLTAKAERSNGTGAIDITLDGALVGECSPEQLKTNSEKASKQELTKPYAITIDGEDYAFAEISDHNGMQENAYVTAGESIAKFTKYFATALYPTFAYKDLVPAQTERAKQFDNKKLDGKAPFPATVEERDGRTIFAFFAERGEKQLDYNVIALKPAGDGAHMNQYVRVFNKPLSAKDRAFIQEKQSLWIDTVLVLDLPVLAVADFEGSKPSSSKPAVSSATKAKK